MKDLFDNEIEIVLNGTAMFNHSNARIPLGIDRWLRLVLVTPDMHRVHHSVRIEETNSNFGFNLPWWDRLLGTYRAQPREGHEAMRIGLEHGADSKEIVPVTKAMIEKCFALKQYERVCELASVVQACKEADSEDLVTVSVFKAKALTALGRH